MLKLWSFCTSRATKASDLDDSYANATKAQDAQFTSSGFEVEFAVALAFIFAGVVLVVIGYKYYVRHGLPPVGHDGRLRA